MRLDDHEALLGRMASRVGADLDDAELRGDLSPGMREALRVACIGCAEPAACARWLDQTLLADAPPDFCRNRDALQALAAI